MRKWMIFTLVLLVFSGCAAPAPPVEGEPLPAAPEEVCSLPETWDLEPLSAPGIVLEGRAPAEDRRPAPPMGDRDYHGNMMRWVRDNTAELVAEAPGAYFYALPRTEEHPEETALILWGESAAEFDGWCFSTPRMFLPEMYCFDFDGDEEDELVVLCYSGSGTGVSVWDLHVVEKNGDGTLTDYSTFRYAEGGSPLWEGVSSLLRLERTGDRAFLILGRELAEVDSAALPEEDRAPFTGSTIQFEVFPEERRVRFLGGVDVAPTWYIADLSADVAYQDGTFTLSNFHLYGNDFFEERQP